MRCTSIPIKVSSQKKNVIGKHMNLLACTKTDLHHSHQIESLVAMLYSNRIFKICLILKPSWIKYWYTYWYTCKPMPSGLNNNFLLHCLLNTGMILWSMSTIIFLVTFMNSLLCNIYPNLKYWFLSKNLCLKCSENSSD